MNKTVFTCLNCGNVYSITYNWCPDCGTMQSHRHNDLFALPTASLLAEMASRVGPTTGQDWQSKSINNAWSLWQAASASLQQIVKG